MIELDIACAEELAKILQGGTHEPSIIIDMGGVTYMESICLTKLPLLRERRLEHGFSPARLVIAALQVWRLVALVKSNTLLAIYDSVALSVQEKS